MMNKPKNLIMLLFSIASILIFSLFTNITVLICTKWYGIIFGVCLMIFAIPFHKLGNRMKIMYVASYLLNTIANCFSVSAYYLTKNKPINAYDLIVSTIPAILILLVLCLLISIFEEHKTPIVLTTAIINVVLLIISIVFWVAKGSTIYSFGFFCLLISLFYLIAFGIMEENQNVLRYISFGSFGSFIILTIVVLVIITEGEALDGLDIGDGWFKKKKGKV